MNVTRRSAPLAISILAAALALTGCAASGSPSSPTSSRPAATAAATSASALAASPSASPSPAASVLCTTHACIVSDIERSLVGLVAKDESVITKAVCFKSTVKDNAGGTYTASCDVTYSDQTVYSGYATLIPAKDQITWEPTEQLQ